MNTNDAQAIANIQLIIALRLDEANRLEKIIASEYVPSHRKNLARERLAKLLQAMEADKNELDRIKTAD
jgi:DNA-directed RNA polymerase subunit H (RpoH/RPB5)